MAISLKKVLAIIAIIVVFLLVITAFSGVLVLAQDDTEGGIPGVDMAALWSLNGGFTWIYPGSSHNANGHTLHNIYMTDNPYQDAKEIMEYTYGVRPHILIIINDQAAAHIFGDDILDTIRQHDWGEGNSRGDAVAMSITSVNLLPVIPDILMGNIKIMLI
ncbi:hypothetical protein [Methanobrevibacter olleyae]|uniref:Uncharacterized protein n=1 Tax=Methanobrevibacter olleyae TaxID=294671 RepID=A0A126QZZ3_METOL|nr:hypothetical protein [Methanobrevibacter olleyae]AMK15683.1 hypothetical protein YLM1_1126 [Methanobrevibacter olleyae]SFL23167.1 hypothetical protein SAMN02910297_00287 [Methanobrevibacter olleyae]